MKTSNDEYTDSEIMNTLFGEREDYRPDYTPSGEVVIYSRHDAMRAAADRRDPSPMSRYRTPSRYQY